MYATAHRVLSLSGQTGINTFVHFHGAEYLWPAEPWRLPETEPGTLSREQVEVRVGGNRVRSYLDILAPDGTPRGELDIALTDLWLELIADESGAAAPVGPMPNPVVYHRGAVVLRFGVEADLIPHRAQEMAELRERIDPSTAPWLEVSSSPPGRAKTPTTT